MAPPLFKDKIMAISTVNLKHGLVHYARKPLDAPNGSYRAHQHLLIAIHIMREGGIPHEHVWESAREMEHIVLPEDVAASIAEVLRDCGFEKVRVEPASAEFYEQWKHNVEKEIAAQNRPKGYMPAPLANKLKETKQ